MKNIGNIILSIYRVKTKAWSPVGYLQINKCLIKKTILRYNFFFNQSENIFNSLLAKFYSNMMCHIVNFDLEKGAKMVSYMNSYENLALNLLMMLFF